MKPQTDLARTVLLILARGLASGLVLGPALLVMASVDSGTTGISGVSDILGAVAFTLLAPAVCYVTLATMQWVFLAIFEFIPFGGVFGLALGFSTYAMVPIFTIPADMLLYLASLGKLGEKLKIRRILTPAFGLVNMPLVLVSRAQEDDKGQALLTSRDILLARSRHFLSPG
jgi:hypothetical protein